MVAEAGLSLRRATRAVAVNGHPIQSALSLANKRASLLPLYATCRDVNILSVVALLVCCTGSRKNRVVVHSESRCRCRPSCL